MILYSYFALPSVVHAQSPNDANVAIVSGSLSVYQEAADTCQRMLTNNGYTCKMYTLPKKANREVMSKWMDSVREGNPKLIVTVGASSTRHILTGIKDTPIVFTMVPNILDASFINPGNHRNRMTGISSDASPQHRISWLTRTGGAVHSVAILYSDATQRTVTSLREAASQQGIEAVEIIAAKDSFMDALASVERAKCDGVLMILDAKVYNSPTVRTLLAWGARNRKPVWAFSENFVKAGAFAGQFLNTQGIGQQTARVAMEILRGRAPRDIDVQYVEAIDTAVNLHTSSMIDKRIPSSALTPNTIRYGENK